MDPQLILYTMILTKGVSISHANSRFHSRSLIVDETSAGIRREGKMDSFRSVTVLNRREREFLLIGGAMVVGQVYRKIHPRQTYILRALTTSLDLESRQKKKLPLSRENCWRNVEKSKDFKTDNRLVFQSETVYVQRREGEREKESQKENKNEERGKEEEEEEEKRERKKRRRTLSAVKFSSMDEMKCARDHKSGREI